MSVAPEWKSARLEESPHGLKSTTYDLLCNYENASRAACIQSGVCYKDAERGQRHFESEGVL